MSCSSGVDDLNAIIYYICLYIFLILCEEQNLHPPDGMLFVDDIPGPDVRPYLVEAIPGQSYVWPR